MNAARPSTCLFCSFKQASKKLEPASRRNFHVSLVRSVRQRRTPIKPLNKDEVKDNYTPQQAAAIDATQRELGDTIKDMHDKTNQNFAPWAMRYMQDMTQINPSYDKAVKAPWSNIDENARLKTDEELDEDMLKFMENMPENDDQAADEMLKFLAENRVTVGKPEAEFDARTAVAPQLPKMIPESQKKKAGAQRRGGDSDGKSGKGSEDDEISPALLRLMQMTGLNQMELRKLRVKSIVNHRVVNQTRLGKIQKQYWLSVAGNGNGLLGIGEGKSEEGAEGMIQSQYRAIRNMVPIMRYEKRTIFGDVKGKESATELELYARPPGFGLRCQHLIFEMCRCAGIHDLAARVTRARNPMNTVKAAFKALQSQKDPEEIAKGRGKKLVDVRKVYYAGNV